MTTLADAQSAAQRAAMAVLIPVQAGASIDRDSVTVGDVIRLAVRVHAPLGATVNFPAAVDSLGPVQSLEPPRVGNGADSARAADRIAVYRMVAWDIGSTALRLGEVLVQTDDGERRVALPLPTLFVRSVLPADTTRRAPKGARPLLPVPVATPWWWWLLAALVAAGLGLVAWRLARRRRQGGGPPTDPLADAERRFAQIEQQDLVAAGEAGRHAALMTDVLRRYLAARVDGATLSQTSEELLRTLRDSPTVVHEGLERLLTAVDRVKFAAAHIGAEEARALGMDSRSLVREEHARAAAIARAAVDAERVKQAARSRKVAA